MKLSEALRIVQETAGDSADKQRIFLACGFMPLHLTTFLSAQIRVRFPDRDVEIQTGKYGDLIGNVARIEKSGCAVAAVVIEWSDLDPRLGLRSLGGWGPKVLADIQDGVKQSSGRVLHLFEEAVRAAPIAVCLPTLPLPPISYLPAAQAGLHDFSLRGLLQDFARQAAAIRGVKLVSQQQLDEESPPSERLDVKSELMAGFPYCIPHASVVAELLAQLIQPRAAKKGLITDLDDTLWRGILGEDGVQGISWDLDNRSHTHALYQQLLEALAESGVLVGIASKNDPDLVKEALERDDMILRKDRFFPIEVNWQEKSRSIERILGAWNVSADSVVFIDDSPLELAEVQMRFPEMECLLFPKSDAQAVYQLLKKLRDLFGKQAIVEEDTIRLDTLRQGQRLRNEVDAKPGYAAEDFLAQVDANVTFVPVRAEGMPRAFELINKTNQFNINGRRLSEADFKAALERSEAISMLVSYNDKYGPLGKIAVLLGWVDFPVLKIDTWVMSCRAFSRRVEHRCLEQLFQCWDVTEIEVDYRPTARNGPVREFLEQFVDQDTNTPWRIRREDFMMRKPALFHSVIHG